MVFVQKRPFFQLFFLTNIGQENVFYDILERKNAFLGYKKQKFKKSKNLHLSKGVNKWLRSENGHCSNFFFDAIMARKMSLTIFQKEKTPLQAKKTSSKKSRKTDIFPNFLTDGFRPNMAIFPTFLFGKYRLGQALLRYSKLRKRLSSLQKQEVQKVEKLSVCESL